MLKVIGIGRFQKISIPTPQMAFRALPDPILSLLEALAVSVPSLHQFRLQCNCSILSLPLDVCGCCVDDVAFAVLSDVLCFMVVFFDPLQDEF